MRDKLFGLQEDKNSRDNHQNNFESDFELNNFSSKGMRNCLAVHYTGS